MISYCCGVVCDTPGKDGQLRSSLPREGGDSQTGTETCGSQYQQPKVMDARYPSSGIAAGSAAEGCRGALQCSGIDLIVD